MHNPKLPNIRMVLLPTVDTLVYGQFVVVIDLLVAQKCERYQLVQIVKCQCNVLHFYQDSHLSL